MQVDWAYSKRHWHPGLKCFKPGRPSALKYGLEWHFRIHSALDYP